MFDTEARMEQVLGKPPRMEPLAQDLLAEEALTAIDRIRVLHDLDPDLPVHPTFATLGKHPGLLASFLDLGHRFLTDTALAPRSRELAILRTGWLCGAPVEWGEHVLKAKQAGVTSEEIERVTRGSGEPGWSPCDQAVLKACEELHADSMISDETWAALALWLDDSQLIELPMIAGHYHMVAYVQNSLRFPVRDENIGLSAR